jgi:cyclophilin family peptidyl-prolyl cis-trans isomerase
VANFLGYALRGNFTNSIIHRSVPGFVIQGGGFGLNGSTIVPVKTDAAVVNEPGISNTRGTVAMAKVDGDPDSATSQWFINLADNSGNLDQQNGGFTVFGRVAGNGMAVADRVAGLARQNLGGALGQLPLWGANATVSNLVRFQSARALAAGARVGFDLYPLPGGKFDGNNSIGGQISLGLIGGGNRWHAADADERRAIWEAHKQYTLEFLHFLQTDPAVPDKVRKQYAGLGLCRDEFPDTGHFPPALYVRESRRMKGMAVLSQRDIIDSPEKEDPIAISSFPIDSHDCQRVALPGGGVINEGTIFPVRVKGTGVGYAYHVPYRAILPKPEQCTNLLVPVALSCTHVGIASLRIEGAWMVIGQAAGVAAALASKGDVAVQELPYPVLRERLLAQGQVLDLPERAPPEASR